MNLLFLMLGVGGLIFCIAGMIQKKLPPKKINHLYGYRTRRSMKSKEVWDFAQQYSAQKMITMGILILLLGLLAEVTGFESTTALWVGLSVLTVFPLLMLWEIESTLKKKFPDKKS